MKEIVGFLGKADCILTEYDDKLVRQLIQNVHILNAWKIEAVFKPGLTVAEMLLQY